MNKTLTLLGEKRKQRITLAVILLSYLPFLLFANDPVWSDTDSVIRWAGSQTGYAAAILLLWQFILGTRSISSLVHKDLVWVTSLHKKLGLYGIALVVAHPLLIAYSYSEDLLYLFYGELETDFGQHVAMGRIAFMLFLIVWVSSALLRAKIGYRPWKYIHYATYLVMPFVLLHAPGVGSFYFADSLFRAGWQIMTGIFIVVLLLRLKQAFMFGQSPYRIVKKSEAAKDVFLYQLEPLGKKLAPSPGQFVYTRRGFWSEEHPFSVANYSSKSGRISIASKVFGKYTKKLSQMPEGSIIYLDGPYGVFTKELDVDAKLPTVFIAGGIGITPFIQHALAKENKQIRLFNANRAPENVVIRDLLKKALGDRYVDVYSDVEVKGAEHGRVDAELLKKHLGGELLEQQYFICGPPPMMSGVHRTLLEAGVPEKQIHTEEFGF